MKKNKKAEVVIVGGGQNGFVVKNILELNPNIKVVGFLDDEIEGTYVIGKTTDYILWKKKGCHFFVAIGSINFRTEMFTILEKAEVSFINAIHPSAVIEHNVEIGKNVMVGALSYLNVGSRIGDNTLVNNACVIEHDVSIGKNCNINPGVVTGGGVIISDNVFVGLGAHIRDHISIGSDTNIGMGSVIVKNVESGKTVYNKLALLEKNS